MVGCKMGPFKFTYFFIFLGRDGFIEGYEMDCSDKPNGEVGTNGCNGIFNCVEYCDGDLCNLASSAIGIYKANAKSAVLVFALLALVLPNL